MLDLIKMRCGYPAEFTDYDSDIEGYIEDCQLDMIESGVPTSIAMSEDRQDVQTAITLYVKTYIGSDRTDSEKYLKLYRDKVFRLALNEVSE